MPTTTDPLRPYRLHLHAAGYSPKTQRTYLDALRRLLTHSGHDRLELITPTDCKGYLGSRIEVISPTSVNVEARALSSWSRWMVGEFGTDPMRGVPKPKPKPRLKPVLTDAEVHRLITTRHGRHQLRDEALLRFMFATGCRLGEVVGLTVESVDVDQRVAVVSGKTGSRMVAFDWDTAKAMDRWLRHSAVDGHRGSFWGLTQSGVYLMLKRRSEAVLGRHVHPHLARHYAVHRLAAAGMTDTNIVTLMGWSSGRMLEQVYATATKSSRALKAYFDMEGSGR